jgi:hypothetical protein
MQPYLFPYMGYYQLVNHVDIFVYFDDVNYKKKGWINRNNLLVNKEQFLWALPIKKISQNKKIYEHQISNFSENKNKFFKLIKNNYSNAPYFDEIYTLLTKVFEKQVTGICELIYKSNEIIFEYLGIKTKCLLSRDLDYDRSLDKQYKIINICKLIGSAEYFNLSSGKDIYDFNLFKDNKIQLNFIKSKEFYYNQFGNEPVPNLSIIDVLMFNSKEKIRNYLLEFNYL